MSVHVNSLCSESLCCGWPGNAAQWFQHCPATGWVQLLERATSKPSLWSWGWTAWNIQVNSSLTCSSGTTEVFLPPNRMDNVSWGWRHKLWLVRSACRVRTRAAWSWQVLLEIPGCHDARYGHLPPLGWTWSRNGPSRALQAAAAVRWGTPHPANTQTTDHPA